MKKLVLLMLMGILVVGIGAVVYGTNLQTESQTVTVNVTETYDITTSGAVSISGVTPNGTPVPSTGATVTYSTNLAASRSIVFTTTVSTIPSDMVFTITGGDLTDEDAGTVSDSATLLDVLTEATDTEISVTYNATLPDTDLGWAVTAGGSYAATIEYAYVSP